MSVTFSTTVLQAPGLKATGLPVPDDAVAALGTSRAPAVTVAIGDYQYRSTVSSRYGGFIIPLSAAHRAAAGLTAGDEVTVTLSLDAAPRHAEVPADLAEALDPDSRPAFDALSPSRRTAHVTHVESAKTPETRARRIATIVGGLRSE